MLIICIWKFKVLKLVEGVLICILSLITICNIEHLNIFIITMVKESFCTWNSRYKIFWYPFIPYSIIKKLFLLINEITPITCGTNNRIIHITDYCERLIAAFSFSNSTINLPPCYIKSLMT